MVIDNNIVPRALYKLESKPPFQCISNGQVCHQDPLFESKPRACYQDYTGFPMFGNDNPHLG